MTQKVQSQDEKERQLIQELKEQKVETANTNSESKSKYEKEIREMSTKVKELTE